MRRRGPFLSGCRFSTEDRATALAALNESNCNQEQMMERPDEYELLKAVHDHQPPIRGNDLISCCARAIEY